MLPKMMMHACRTLGPTRITAQLACVHAETTGLEMLGEAAAADEFEKAQRKRQRLQEKEQRASECSVDLVTQCHPDVPHLLSHALCVVVAQGRRGGRRHRLSSMSSPR